MHKDSLELPPHEKAKRKMGLFAGLVMLVGSGLLAVTGLGVVNTLFDLNLALGTAGSTTALPKRWDAVIGLGCTSLLVMGISYFGSTGAHMFAEAKGKPMVRAGIVVGALVLLVGTGRGLQIVALTTTYGSMLAYYCTDEGSIDDVKKELADKPSPQALDGCLGRTAQWDRAELLPLVIYAGATFEDKTSKYPRCVLKNRVSQAYVDKAIALGASPKNCPRTTVLIHQKVSRAKASDDAKLVKIVKSLLQGGWSASNKPKHSKQTTIQIARRRKFRQTLAVLEGGSGLAPP